MHGSPFYAVEYIVSIYEYLLEVLSYDINNQNGV